MHKPCNDAQTLPIRKTMLFVWNDWFEYDSNVASIRTDTDCALDFNEFCGPFCWNWKRNVTWLLCLQNKWQSRGIAKPLKVLQQRVRLVLHGSNSSRKRFRHQTKYLNKLYPIHTQSLLSCWVHFIRDCSEWCAHVGTPQIKWKTLKMVTRKDCRLWRSFCQTFWTFTWLKRAIFASKQRKLQCRHGIKSKVLLL